MATPSRSAGDWTRLFGLIGIWGTAFLFIDLSVETIPPATLVAIRVSVAAAVLVVLARVLGLTLPRSGVLWLRFLLLACVGNATPFFLIGWGQQTVPSGLTGILMAVMPFATLMLAHFFVPGEGMTVQRTVGFVLGFGGVVVLTGPEALTRLEGTSSTIVGQLAILGGALCYAINTILAGRMPPTHPLVSAACTMVMASCVMLPVSAIFDHPWLLEPSRLSVVSAVWLGLVPTAFATVIYFRIVSSAGPTFLALMNYVIPAVALITGIAVLDEPFEWRILGALVLILCGLYTSQRAGPGDVDPAL